MCQYNAVDMEPKFLPGRRKRPDYWESGAGSRPGLGMGAWCFLSRGAAGSGRPLFLAAAGEKIVLPGEDSPF